MNLYQRSDDQGDFVLYCADDHPLLQEDLDRLHRRGISRLYIESGARESFQQYLQEVLNPAAGEEATIQAKTGALNYVVKDVLETQFRGGNTDSTVAEAIRLGEVTAEILSHDQFAAGDLCRVLQHDYATFTHSANVAFYAGILAAELGYETVDVQKITTAGLLHDLGKLKIDQRILRTPRKLTHEEFEIIKSHPTLGFEQLAFREDLCEGQLMMVYQHHERLDGGGYPVGLVDSEIHPWAKICAVVDVYEALTSFRPYRSPMPREKVFEIMKRESGKSFEPEFLECWIRITNKIWDN